MAPKKTTQKNTFRWFFLKEFTKQLVIASIPSHSVLPSPKERIPIKPFPSAQLLQIHPIQNQHPQPPLSLNIPDELPALPISQNQGVRIPFNPNAETANLPSLAKISNMLKDPSVLSIECPGPDKKILVNRSGSNQITQVSLKKEEIDKITEEASQKSKIPLTPGLFKTALGNIILTAVISDYVGTRFVIYKRNPFQGQRIRS